MSILMFKFSFHWNQEEEQRLRKVAVNISKDVKKFWVKIEKLVNLSRMV
jgi:E1A-binding protein p400